MDFIQNFSDCGLWNEAGQPTVNPRQLEAGTAVEMEHTCDPEMAKRIALDHLAEIPDYYTWLYAMEKIAEHRKLVIGAIIAILILKIIL